MSKLGPIKRLLKKKKLTGREAARLLLASFWEKDHGREPILSQVDIDRIRFGLSSQKDIEEYNDWIDAYKLLDYTMREAQGQAAAITSNLEQGFFYLRLYSQQYYFDEFVRAAPESVTEDKALKAKLARLNPHLKRWAEIATKNKKVSTLEEALREDYEITRQMIAQLLAAEAVFEATGRLLGVDFMEEVREWRPKVRQVVTKYNAALMAANIGSYYDEDGPALKLPKIKLDELEPDEDWLEYYQERMAMSLADNWYDEAMEEFETAKKKGKIRPEEVEPEALETELYGWLEEQIEEQANG